MKKRKHPYGYYRRPCIIDIIPIPGLSNNNLRMNHIISNRTHTLISWMNKHWNSENKAMMNKIMEEKR